jgi:indolepyruvate ferredoxin oxidoreductase
MRGDRAERRAVEGNLRAFEIGRWAVVHPDRRPPAITPAGGEAEVAGEKIAFRAAHLTAYQGRALARRYRKLVLDRIDDRLREAVAKGYHKLLSYKDEYEVARLHLQTWTRRAEFDGDFTSTSTSPRRCCRAWAPTAGRRSAKFGPWILRAFRLLARMKVLRGTPLDPFGYSAERKMERALIRQYESDMAEICRRSRPQTRDAAMRWPNCRCRSAASAR